MARATRTSLAGKLPVTLITGFLGSGKTTLLGQLLRHPDMNRAAVVINEIGEVGIDHDLVTVLSENVTLLANGCICCTVRTDLQEALRELFGQRRAGQIPDFDRVMVETTGLADPAPVVQTLVSDTMLSAHYRLDGIVTLVDAVNSPNQLDTQPEAEKQIALADKILITKSDLLSQQDVKALASRLASINSAAGILQVVHGQVEPSALTGMGLASADGGLQTLRFLGEAQDEPALFGRYGWPQAPPAHLKNIKTFAMRFDNPFEWASFSAAMDVLMTLRGPDLLRVKGIVNVAGQPVVVQCVQHIFHPPVTLDKWPSPDTGSRLVFITRNMQEPAVRGIFAAVGAMAPGV